MKFTFARVIGALTTRVPNKRLVYIHVPKTAGSSVDRALKNLYFNPFHPLKKSWMRINPHASMAASKYLKKDLFEYREELLVYALLDENVKYISGHNGFSPLVYDGFRDDTCFVSVLRNPIERYLSEYFYNRYKRSQHCKTELSLDEYTNSELGAASSKTYLSYFGVSTGGYVKGVSYSLEAALNNIGKLDVVGVVEDLGGFISQVSDVLEQKIVLEHVNKNPKKEYMSDLTSEQLKLIESMCADDMEIYEKAISISRGKC